TTVATTTTTTTTVAPTTTTTTTTVAPTTTTTTTRPTTTTTSSTTTTTAPPPSSGGARSTNCWPSPHLCGFADETNTGVRAGAALSTARSGANWSASGNTLTITGDVGSANTGLEVADGTRVVISCAGCTVVNLKVNGAHGQSTDGVTVSSG